MSSAILKYWKDILEDQNIPDFDDWNKKEPIGFKKLPDKKLIDMINYKDIYERIIKEKYSIKQDNLDFNFLVLKEILTEPVQYLFISTNNYTRSNETKNNDDLYCSGITCVMILKLKTDLKIRNNLIQINQKQFTDDNIRSMLEKDIESYVDSMELILPNKKSDNSTMERYSFLKNINNDEIKPVYEFYTKKITTVVNENFITNFIPRSLMIPQYTKNNKNTILKKKNDEYLDVSDVYNQNDEENYNNVNDIYNYWENFFQEITIPEGYQIDTNIYLLPVKKNAMQNKNIITKSLVNNFDTYLNNNINLLAQTYINDQTKQNIDFNTLNSINLLDHYRGSMDSNHGLSPSQTDAVTAYSQIKEGDILAVNGPPGTGKTTLLRSIVASEVVKSILQSNNYKDCKPVKILCTSSTNQAIVNLNKGMSDIIEENESNQKLLTKYNWIKRWINIVPSYGLYIPSQMKQSNAITNKYQIANYKDEKFLPIEFKENKKEDISKIEYNFINKRINYNDLCTQWLKEFNESYLVSYNNIEESLKEIYKNITQLHKNITILKECYNSMCNENYDNKRERLESTNYYFELNLITKDYSTYSSISKLLQNYNSFKFFFFFNEKKKFWSKIFNLMEKINKKPTDIPKTKNIKTWKKFIDKEKKRTAKTVKQYNKMKKFNITILQENEKLTLKKDQDSNLIIYKLLLNMKIDKQNLSEFDGVFKDRLWTSNKEEDIKLINEFLDTNIRFELFQKSCRYWEGRWLLLKCQSNEYTIDNNSMLMPCVISTLHKTPIFDKKDNDTFDLLIIDEAGQASPLLGFSAMNMCKKAIVVGDIFQLEPVVQLNKFIDAGRCEDNGLEYFKYKNNELCSNNNRTIADDTDITHKPINSIMRIAQEKTKFTVNKPEDIEQGMFLKEHRRCYDQIIQICNELIYNGRLIPCKGEGKNSNGLLVLDFYDIKNGEAIKEFDSKVNRQEIQSILNYLFDHIKNIVDEETLTGIIEQTLTKDDYKDIENKLKQKISIITPFKGQSILLKIELKNRWKDYIKDTNPEIENVVDIFKKINIGTVHTMQGAESDIVIFSSVYDGKNDTSFMLNNKPNLLNVAVSRAKKHFIIFGSKNIFFPDKKNESNKYSNIVGENIMKYKNTNELKTLITTSFDDV